METTPVSMAGQVAQRKEVSLLLGDFSTGWMSFRSVSPNQQHQITAQLRRHSARRSKDVNTWHYQLKVGPCMHSKRAEKKLINVNNVHHHVICET